MKRYLILILIVLVLASGVVSCGGSTVPTTGTTPSEASPSAQPQQGDELKQFQQTKRMELVTRLQQVNEEIIKNMEEIYKVTDEINILYGDINSSIQRKQMANDSLNYWQKYDDRLKSQQSSNVQSTLAREDSNISLYHARISEKRARLSVLQTKQLELEKEKNALLTELAKLGQ